MHIYNEYICITKNNFIHNSNTTMNTSLKQLNFESHHKVKMIILVRICTSVHKCNHSRLIETIAIVRLKFKQNCGELPISFAETKPHPLANTPFERVRESLGQIRKDFFQPICSWTRRDSFSLCRI